MRRCILLASGLILMLSLAACGNKGPLVRAPTQAATAPAPAAATSAAMVPAVPQS